jgi:hypothetical protein
VLIFKNGNIDETIATKGQEILDAILSLPGMKIIGKTSIGINWGHT